MKKVGYGRKKHPCWVTLKIPIENKQKMDTILNAEDMLHKAGVTFDTAYDFETNTREWQMDFALKGGIMECKKPHQLSTHLPQRIKVTSIKK